MKASRVKGIDSEITHSFRYNMSREFFPKNRYPPSWR